MSQMKLMPKEARYSVRLSYVMFPLEFRDIRGTLAKRGFDLAEVGPIPPRPTGISFSGELGRKGESVVYMSIPENRFGTMSKSLKQAVGTFEELSEAFTTELGTSLHSNVWYYEVAVHYLCDTGSSPVEKIGKIVKNNPYYSEFSKVLGRDMSTFSVRLSPMNKIPNREEWLDIAIEHDALSNFYHVGVVFRNPEKRHVEEFVSNLEKKIEELIQIVEGKE